jgi:CubicO group peptidase (beta-lactamase class C family)
VRRIYSNTGYVAAASALESASGMAFADYLAEGVLEPLGMTGTELLPTSVGAPAAGLSGPLTDLVALAREWAQPTLVSPATWRQATSVQFAGLGGVLPGFGLFAACDWGLGVELRDGKWPHWTGTSNSPATYGHFGQSGSFLWVDPVAGVLCCGLADRPFGGWASRAWPALAEAVLASSVAGAPDDPTAP